MDFWDSVLGFITVLILAAVSLTGIHLHLKRSTAKTLAIKGYLDLIPDLTEEQRALVQ